MRSIRLEEIIPTEAEIHLSAINKTYRLRAINLDDEVWLVENFGPRIQEIFEKAVMSEVCKIAYHQLEEEAKQDFFARDIPFTDEQGEKKTIRRGGAELFRACVTGHQEKIALLKALLHTLGISKPILDELTQEAEQEIKKKIETLDRIRKENPEPIGEKSLTSSPVSMDGRSEKSES